MSLHNLDRLGNSVSVSIPPDEDGFVGRECPDPNCLGYFKVEFGTGLKGEGLPCHCPYCGHQGPHDEFWTPEQIEYAKSVAMHKITRALEQDLRQWGRKLERDTRGGFLQLKMKYRGSPHPIRYYEEKELETDVVCSNCTLHYTIYGIFGFCPDCGTHNSLQILHSNLDLIEKVVAKSASEDAQFRSYLLSDALENTVSSFDGFGREICRVNAGGATDPNKAKYISFQNLANADRYLKELFGLDMAATLLSQEWDFMCRCFQKRHVIAHRMGVVDQAYIDMSADQTAVVGRKLPVGLDEVRRLVSDVRELAAAITDHFT